MKRDESSTKYDPLFKNIGGLAWFPWVGANYPKRLRAKRLLIVAESHYVKAGRCEDSPTRREKLAKLLDIHLADKGYTRSVVSEYCVNDAWGCHNRTLDAIPKTLFETLDIDRERFWGDTAFYNFVQRPMDYERQGGAEQATWKDFFSAWSVFAEIVEILMPSHCLFFGVRASTAFDAAVIESGRGGRAIAYSDKLNNVFPREAAIQGRDEPIPVTFIKHPARYFSSTRWNSYLTARHPALMQWIESEAYLTAQ